MDVSRETTVLCGINYMCTLWDVNDSHMLNRMQIVGENLATSGNSCDKMEARGQRCERGAETKSFSIDRAVSTRPVQT